MKKFFFILLLALGWLGVSGQEVVYGPLDIAGFSKVIKGANWTKRPWARIIHEGGSIPNGCRVDTLKVPHFIMFYPGENNRLDRNYIIAPAGSLIIYWEGFPYLSDCANRIYSIRPVSDFLSMVVDTVDRKIILRDTVYIPSQPQQKGSAGGVSINFFVNSFNQTAQKDSTQTTSLPAPEKKKKIIPKIIGGVIIAGLATGVTYLLLKDKKIGSPGGAPVTPDEKGGPGGSPVTVGFLFPLRF